MVYVYVGKRRSTYSHIVVHVKKRNSISDAYGVPCNCGGSVAWHTPTCKGSIGSGLEGSSICEASVVRHSLISGFPVTAVFKVCKNVLKKKKMSSVNPSQWVEGVLTAWQQTQLVCMYVCIYVRTTKKVNVYMSYDVHSLYVYIMKLIKNMITLWTKFDL